MVWPPVALPLAGHRLLLVDLVLLPLVKTFLVYAVLSDVSVEPVETKKTKRLPNPPDGFRSLFLSHPQMWRFVRQLMRII